MATRAKDAEVMEGSGPVLMDAAATSKPHLPQRGKEISLFEKDGKTYVDVPLFRMGIFRHPKGILKFNQAFVDKIIDNHRQSITDYNVSLDLRHTDEKGSLAFLDADDGGYIEQREKWVHVCGPVVDEEARALIASRRWRYSSPHLVMNYKSNMVYKLELADLKDYKEQMMSTKTMMLGGVEVKLTKDDEGNFILEDVESLETVSGKVKDLTDDIKNKDDKIKTLEGQVSDLSGKVDKLTADLKAARKEGDGESEDDLPPAVKARLEAMETELKLSREREADLERQRHKDRVLLTLDRAKKYVDNKGMGHSAVFLQLVQKGLLLEEFKDKSDDSFKLENGSAGDPVQVARYFQNLLRTMAETIPGQQPVEQRGREDNDPLAEVRMEYSEEDLAEEIQNFKDKY